MHQFLLGSDFFLKRFKDYHVEDYYRILFDVEFIRKGFEEKILKSTKTFMDITLDDTLIKYDEDRAEFSLIFPKIKTSSSYNEKIRYDKPVHKNVNFK